MSESCPTLYPLFQVVPFQHLYQLLEEEAVDVVIAFQEKGLKKETGIYKELTQVHVTAVLPVDQRVDETQDAEASFQRPG